MDGSYGPIRDVLMLADPSGKGLIEKDILVKVLQSLGDTPLTTTSLDGLLECACPKNGDEVPIRLFLDYVFQRFPGLPGAEDTDLSAIFELIDKNGNGVIEKSEVLRAAQSPDDSLTALCTQIPCLMPFLDARQWERAFKSMDTNEDGVISWFEFVHFFAHSGRPCKNANDAEKVSDLSALFSCVDRNSNGVLEKSEVLAAVNSQDSSFRDFCKQVPSVLPLLNSESWQQAFEKLDTNADGLISWAEFIAFFKPVCR
mmetsp:Transcript_1778/g.3034  ORF Transcript_1778/g.3034 Transcript_1778/m.3034 type:complete len:257 (-) Transcript_1778:87-857(-)